MKRALIYPAMFLAACIIALGLAAPASQAHAGTTAPSLATSTMEPALGHLNVTVAIIVDLAVKPVPLTEFDITGPDNETLRTNTSGVIDADLPPGHYHIASRSATTFAGRDYRWSADFDVASGIVTRIVWTDSDAATYVEPSDGVTTTQAAPTDETRLYDTLKSAVVTVEGDQGTGSGFVVDPRGLVLTCHHVIAGGRWAAIRFGRTVRLPAVIVEDDPVADAAVLAFNPAAYSAFTVAKLADPSAGPLAVEGEKVFAIGSPLHQDTIITTGIISKVEGDYMVSDVNINHGNSGGPLFDYDSNVIGITTFGDDSDEGGPGISGIVPISKSLPALRRAQIELPSVKLPPAELLPTMSTLPIPAESLMRKSVSGVKPLVYLSPKDFVTVIGTPFYIAARANEADAKSSVDQTRRIKKRDGDGIRDELQTVPPGYWQHGATGDFDPVIDIEVDPILMRKLEVHLTDLFPSPIKRQHKPKAGYRDDFWDMALFRDDTLVQPVARGRGTVSGASKDGSYDCTDVAYCGVYRYDPSAFSPGATVSLYIRRESDLNRWDAFSIDPNAQAHIYNQFEGYLKLRGDWQSPTVIGLSGSIHTPPYPGAENPAYQWMSDTVASEVTPGSTVAALQSRK